MRSLAERGRDIHRRGSAISAWEPLLGILIFFSKRKVFLRLVGKHYHSRSMMTIKLYYQKSNGALSALKATEQSRIVAIHELLSRLPRVQYAASCSQSAEVHQCERIKNL